jgi:hypothetical protein
MADLKLPKLPERTPVKLTVTVSPELKKALDTYADAYEAAYGERESVADLIPFMLAGFLESDRAFARAHLKSPGTTGGGR